MPTNEFKRKLTAILSADVQGYSRLMGEDEDATIRTLTAYREMMSSLIQKHRGRVVDSPGDNLLAEFLSVVDAVRCAVEIQEELRVRNDELPENRRMEFRIGINLGDVVAEGERIYGDGVNIAARVEGLAEGGGICISGTVYDSIKNKLSLSYESLGEHTVKNIKEPIRVYRMRIGPEAAAPVIRDEKAGLRVWKKAALAAGAVLVVVAGVWAVWHFYFRPPTPPAEVASEKALTPQDLDEKSPPIPAEPSIAVLPFANISGDPKEDYLSDGITEQIITALSKIPRVMVIARNSVFTYKGKPVMVQQVSEELGVQYMLEGSVQRSGDRLRITAQLIDAKTGRHLWSERYDRDLKDLFALQDDITKNVIMSLEIKVRMQEVACSFGQGTKNLEAYLKVLKGANHFYRKNSNDNEIARQFFEEAIALDPNYANAYVFLAWTYNWEAYFGWTKRPAGSYEKALELAKKAISLDEQNARTYGVIANVYAKARQFDKAIAAGKKGLSLEPTSAAGNFQYGNVLRFAGKFKEAIPFLKKAIRLDPKHPPWYLDILGQAYVAIGQNEGAIAAFRKQVSREPSNARAHCLLGIAFIGVGKPEEAIPVLEKALSLKPDLTVWYERHLAIARFGTGKKEEAVKTMQDLVSSHPNSPGAYLGLSMVQTYEGKYEEAFSMVKKAISLRGAPGAPPYYYRWLGVPYLMIGEYEEAIAAFKKAINIGPEYIYGHIGLAASYNSAGRMEEARAQVAEVLKINPKITLEDIAKNGYYTFPKPDKERFINALRKAGLK